VARRSRGLWYNLQRAIATLASSLYVIEGSIGSGGRGRPWQTRPQVAALARTSATATCLLSIDYQRESLVSQYQLFRSHRRPDFYFFKSPDPYDCPSSHTLSPTANRRRHNCTPQLTMKPVVSAFNAWTWCAHLSPLSSWPNVNLVTALSSPASPSSSSPSSVLSSRQTTTR
jgi:hypothetical protein